MTRIWLARLLPFLRWFPVQGATLRSDLIAGVTVAMVIIPQAMAYAGLAGLPVIHGLYAAFLPVMVAAMWGYSNQLSSGPVVVASLLTVAALGPVAVIGSAEYVSLAIALALMVGAIQLALASFKLGDLVSFLSQPVIIGFINAAAFIIALSQINKLVGIPMDSSGWLLRDVWNVFRHIHQTHLPTLAMGLGALAIILGVKALWPRAPGVMMAAVITTTLSWAIDFERKAAVSLNDIVTPEIRTLAEPIQRAETRTRELNQRFAEVSADYQTARRTAAADDPALAALRSRMDLIKLELANIDKRMQSNQRALREFVFERASDGDGPGRFFLEGHLPDGVTADGSLWRIQRVREGRVMLSGGGDVVGAVSAGLPPLSLPALSWERFMALLPSAFILAVFAFTGVISGARAMAMITKQRVRPNQELFGQGMANVVGSFTSCYPVGGALARTAVNLRAGAQTGMASVFTGLVVMVLLLFFTSLLYHMPQAFLAAVLLTAVASLIDFGALRFAWRANRHDGMAFMVTFVGTLAFAPNIDRGILVGATTAILLHLYRSMKPRMILLGRHPDGALRDARLYELPTSEHVIALRFDGPLYFANVPYFEDTLLEILARSPKARYVLIQGAGISEIDASGQEALRDLTRRLRENGITLAVTSLRHPVAAALAATGVRDEIGEQNIFRRADEALDIIAGRIQDPDFDATRFPLRIRA